ncbi:MAG: hypothetical protein ACR2OI_07305 [Acidimicrobiia bacterium]
MTTIKTTCSACGDVELAANDLVLELTPMDATGRYSFSCPFCESHQFRPANERVVAILLAVGVSYIVGEEVVSEIEIKDFVDSLDDWLEDITAA